MVSETPGEEYEFTAHNLGFLVVDRVAERNGIRVGRRDCGAFVGQGTVAGKKVLLAKPQTFMNDSGESVQGLLVKNEIAPGDVVLVYDELDLPWQSVRIRPNGSAAGHRGVDSVIRCVGTKEFPRVRLGVHGGRREKDGAQIVLAKLKRAHKKSWMSCWTMRRRQWSPSSLKASKSPWRNIIVAPKA